MSEMEPYPLPVPIRMPVPSARRRIRRSAETSARMARRVTPVLVHQAATRRVDRAEIAHAVRLVCEELGATYVKFGQLVASAPGVVGEDVSAEFRHLLDRGPRVPFSQVRRILEHELGRPYSEVFSAFDETPVAAASIATVHRARLHSGETVAVKVLRPGIANTVASDLDLMDPIIRVLAEQGSDQAAVLHNYLVGLRAQVAEELDLRNEAKAMEYFRDLFKSFHLDLLAIPRVYDEFSGRRVLVMEFFDGAPIDDLSAIEGMGLNPRPFVNQLLQAWILSGLLASVFHGDIHAGNLLLLPKGRLGMVDWGIVARLDPATRGVMQGLVEASLGDDEAWARIATFMNELQGGALQAGLGLSDLEIYHLVRNMMEPVLTKPLSEVSMSILFAGSDEMLTLARGTPPGKRGIRERYHLNRMAAATNRAAIRNGFTESPFRRANFLAAKQLVYLEKYARMYMPEVAILGDHPFLRSVIDRIKDEGVTSLEGDNYRPETADVGSNRG